MHTSQHKMKSTHLHIGKRLLDGILEAHRTLFGWIALGQWRTHGPGYLCCLRGATNGDGGHLAGLAPHTQRRGSLALRISKCGCHHVCRWIFFSLAQGRSSMALHLRQRRRSDSAGAADVSKPRGSATAGCYRTARSWRANRASHACVSRSGRRRCRSRSSR